MPVGRADRQSFFAFPYKLHVILVILFSGQIHRARARKIALPPPPLPPPRCFRLGISTVVLHGITTGSALLLTHRSRLLVTSMTLMRRNGPDDNQRYASDVFKPLTLGALFLSLSLVPSRALSPFLPLSFFLFFLSLLHSLVLSTRTRTAVEIPLLPRSCERTSTV